MRADTPRVIIAGTNSGSGKTTLSCAILSALKNRGLQCGAFKCGPDYIDPMFHRAACGNGGNLDSFFFDENTLRYLLAKYGTGKDISIIEGVMGFYDGLGIKSTTASTYDIARITRTPVILLVDGKGAALSVLAVIKGFMEFLPDNNIRGVILNNCSNSTYTILKDEINETFSGTIKPLGYLPKMTDCGLESRHLGLITAEEIDNLSEIFNQFAQQAEDSIDLDGILTLARTAPALAYDALDIPKFNEPVKIGIAMDKAFCFYYRENLDLLKEMGAELIPFSPLRDEKIPDDIHGLYLGGGYPEIYRKELSDNSPMRNSVKSMLRKGLPCIAECGGFMYLTEMIADAEMAAFLSGHCADTGHLTRFGYIRLRSNKASMLFDEGDEIPAHEFHYWFCDAPGSDFTAEKLSGRSWNCAIGTETLYAGFPHFNFYTDLRCPARFYQACLKYKETP